MKDSLQELCERSAEIFGVSVGELLATQSGRRRSGHDPRDAVFEARACLIRMARRVLGMGDAELARELGVSATFVFDVEHRGRPRPDKKAYDAARRAKRIAGRAAENPGEGLLWTSRRARKKQWERQQSGEFVDV